MDSRYPGPDQHQALLEAIVAHYQYDARILAISLFGSLSRDTWDPHTDIDLDVIVADEVHVNVLDELKSLCASLAGEDQQDAVIVADGNDAADVVFGSLQQFSIRYHPLATTIPNIVNSLRVLAGRLDHATIAAAGLSNRQTPARSLGPLLDQCVRYVAVADVAVQRGQLWGAIEMLHRFRGVVMEMYTLTHGGERSLQVFQAEADCDMQVRLGRTLPQYDWDWVHHSLECCLEILETDLGQFARGQLRLTNAHRKVLAQVRARLSQPKNDNQ